MTILQNDAWVKVVAVCCWNSDLELNQSSSSLRDLRLKGSAWKDIVVRIWFQCWVLFIFGILYSNLFTVCVKFYAVVCKVRTHSSCVYSELQWIHNLCQLRQVESDLGLIYFIMSERQLQFRISNYLSLFGSLVFRLRFGLVAWFFWTTYIWNSVRVFVSLSPKVCPSPSHPLCVSPSPGKIPA